MVWFVCFFLSFVFVIFQVTMTVHFRNNSQKSNKLRFIERVSHYMNIVCRFCDAEKKNSRI